MVHWYPSEYNRSSCTGCFVLGQGQLVCLDRERESVLIAKMSILPNGSSSWCQYVYCPVRVWVSRVWKFVCKCEIESKRERASERRRHGQPPSWSWLKCNCLQLMWCVSLFALFLAGDPVADPVVTSGGVLSVINSYAQSYGPPTSPANSRGFAPANSPGALDMYSSSQDSMGYVQAASPQPSGFPSIAVSMRISLPPWKQSPQLLFISHTLFSIFIAKLIRLFFHTSKTSCLNLPQWTFLFTFTEETLPGRSKVTIFSLTLLF